jgi:adenylate kinase
MTKVLRIVLFGPQGSGKGTQAEMLAKKYNLPVLATGDIFRREIKNQTELGELAASLINQGKLVPDEITNKIIIDELTKEKYKNGFILDGYPRNMRQLEDLEKSVGVTYAIELMVSDSEAVKRLGGRRICSKCGAIYHLQNKPAKKIDICDVCGGKLIVRDDDKPEAIKKRLKICHQETEPILNYYFERKKLIRVNGEQPIEKVFEDILSALK